MADMNFFTDFKKLWGSTGTIEPVTQDQYQLGWAYIGALPPAVEQFNKVQQLSDEKIKWLFTQIETYATAHGIPLSALTTDALGLSLAHALAAIVTAPQFDNDTSPASTAFVQRALGNFQGHYVPSNGELLTAARAGSSIGIVVGVTAITLPALANVPVGAVYFVAHTGSVACTISTSAGGSITSNGTLSSTFTLQSGDSIALEKADSNIWLASGPGALKSSNSYRNSLASSGYQRLPSGLIFQWGTVAASGAFGPGTVVTLPTAFLVSGYQAVATYDYPPATSYPVPAVAFAGLSQITIGASAAGSMRYIAIGQ